MSRVYIVQKQMRWDTQAEKLVPRFNLDSAEQYGDMEFLLSPTAAPFSGQPIVDEMRHKLQHFQEEDYLLLVGNPVLIGWAMTLASQYSDRVKALQWSGKDQSYIPVEANLHKQLD